VHSTRQPDPAGDGTECQPLSLPPPDGKKKTSEDRRENREQRRLPDIRSLEDRPNDDGTWEHHDRRAHSDRSLSARRRERASQDPEQAINNTIGARPRSLRWSHAFTTSCTVYGSRQQFKLNN
jgi:hypothetical protein